MKRTLITILLLYAFIGLHAQENLCQKSTEGTDFWFGFMENRNPPEDSTQTEYRYVEVIVTSRKSTTFSISVGQPGREIFKRDYNVDADDSTQVRIPWEFVEANGSEQPENKGIHLVSNNPVNVYALNWEVNSADVTVIYPTNLLGKEYFAMCYYPNIASGSFLGSGRNSEFLIVASDDFTNIEITPTKTTHEGIPADSTFTIVLSKGEVYQVQSENLPGTSQEGQGDLTGSRITADKPIAVFSGSLAATIPAGGGQIGWDHLFEHIPPIHLWGKEYFAVPLKSRQQDRYRILAAEDNTTVKFGGSAAILNRGEFREGVFSEPNPIIADKPVLVAQYSQSNRVDSAYTNGNGDPFMIILNSVDQYKNDVRFTTFRSPEITENLNYPGIQNHYVNIVAKTDHTQNILLDGFNIQDSFKLFPGEEDYSYAQLEINEETHRLWNTDEEQGFLAYVYGFGGYESYGYSVGFTMDPLLNLDAGSTYFKQDTLLLCQGDTLTLDAGPYFDNYIWIDPENKRLPENSQKTDITEGGWYSVTGLVYNTNDTCYLIDSIFIYQSKPEIDVGPDIPTCEPFIEFMTDDGYERYLWQNEIGDTLFYEQYQDYAAYESGKYQLTVFDEYNCTASDVMELTIYPVPKVEYAGDTLFCDLMTATINLEISGVPEDIWNYDESYNWSTDKPDTTRLSFSNSKHTSVEVNVDEWGDYKIYYSLTTIDNCEVIYIINLSFYPSPSSSFEFDTPDVCGDYTREIKYTGGSMENASYYWDFGDSQIIDSIGWDNYIVSLGTISSNQNIQLVVEENGCFSEVTSKTIGANPNFRMETSKTRGCDSLTVLFAGELLVPEPVVYEWDFGDGTPINNSPNPEHSYPDVGFYDVNLTVTNQENGCVAGLQIDSLVKVFPTPVAAISADPEFCYEDSAQIFYTHNIDSTIAFWNFNGMHQSGGGNDSITVILDEPVGEVMLTVDEFGCLSDTAIMRLKRKPHFDFYTDYEIGCAPYTAQIYAQAFDDRIRFEWVTDSLPYPTGELNAFVYQKPGEYDVGLVAGSILTECYDTLIKYNWIKVNPSPEADFNVDFSVALIDNSTITFINSSLDADFYDWDFGDGQFSTQTNPQHTYREVGEFDVVLIVESENGCTDTTNYIIQILPTTSYTPNAFRPESPIEKNRTFMPLGEDALQLNFRLKIYDRLGQLIFESNSTSNPWDGKTLKGNPAPMGNYVWVADFVDVQGIEKHQKGQVLLIR